jgi:hypothetical protein
MKAQIAFEFIAYIALATIVTVSFLVLTISYSTFVVQGQQEEALEDLALSIQQELLVASQTSPGFHRIINIPSRLTRGDYSLANDQQSITLNSSDGQAIILDTPPLNGTLLKGENLIRHINGTIYITN